MKSRNIQLDVSLKRYKDEILEKLSTNDLMQEIIRRIERNGDFNKNNFTKNLEITVDFDLTDYEDEIFHSLHDEDIENEVVNRNLGYIVSNINKKSIINLLGLQPWVTDEQILEELKYKE